MVTHKATGSYRRQPKDRRGKASSLKNKQILITAGPTWVSIDRVRVISNLATGHTGRLIAQKLKPKKARVTLLLGPVSFDQLQGAIKRELRGKKFDIVIHSAAVSDYRLKTTPKNKISSGIRAWKLQLVPTPKIIDSIKKISPGIILVGFKFTPQAGRRKLIREAGELKKRVCAEIVVANTLSRNNRYSAYLLGPDQHLHGPYMSKSVLADKLIAQIENILSK